MVKEAVWNGYKIYRGWDCKQIRPGEDNLYRHLENRVFNRKTNVNCRNNDWENKHGVPQRPSE